MSSVSVFSFEKQSVRTLGTSENPLFVAIDVASALGYSQPAKSVNDRVDPEDLIKAEVETKGGIQTVNCVNESGLYALIFGSKLESAKRFKRWVTSEVLPAIRRTGRYECPVAATQTIDAAQQLAIRNAVAHRAKNVAVHYQTIYHALYERFQIPRYTDLRRADFDEALRFIANCEIRPQLEDATSTNDSPFSTLEMERIRNHVYCMKYLFRPSMKRFLHFLQSVNSPLAPRFWELVYDVNLTLLEKTLEKHGFAVSDMDCYKALTSGR